MLMKIKKLVKRVKMGSNGPKRINKNIWVGVLTVLYSRLCIMKVNTVSTFGNTVSVFVNTVSILRNTVSIGVG
jgi:hypothetical protein